jgi:hypothetical protein
LKKRRKTQKKEKKIVRNWLFCDCVPRKGAPGQNFSNNKREYILFLFFVVWKRRLFHNFHNLYECHSEEAPLLQSRSIPVTGGASSINQTNAKAGASSAN